MKQKNLRYLTEREVRRRPKFVSLKEIEKKKTRLVMGLCFFSYLEKNYAAFWSIKTTFLKWLKTTF